MQGLLSIKLWGIIFVRLMNAIFPTILVLLVFSYKDVRKAWKTPYFRLFMVFMAVEVLSRVFVFFMGLPFQGRYLYSISIFACILAGAGLLELARLSEPYLKKIGIFRNVSAVAVILVIVLAIDAGKGLANKNDKNYLEIITALVKENCPRGKPIIISEINDVRIGYYAKSDILNLTYKGSNDKYVVVNKGWCIWLPDSRPVASKSLPVAQSDDMGKLPVALSHLGNENVFLVVRLGDQDFRSMFGISDSSPSVLTHLKTFKDDSGKPVSMYRLNTQKP